MSKIRVFSYCIVLLFILALTSCGEEGGTITLINESSYKVTSAHISLGNTNESELVPGQWIKSSVEKNVYANLGFTISGEYREKITVSHEGNWNYFNQWHSGIIPVHNGDAVIVIIKNIDE